MAWFDAHSVEIHKILHLSSEYVSCIVGKLTFCVINLVCLWMDHEPCLVVSDDGCYAYVYDSSSLCLTNHQMSVMFFHICALVYLV